MFKNKPVTLLITAGLLILLIATAGIYPLISGSIRSAGPGGMGGGNRTQMQGVVPGSIIPLNGEYPSDMTPPKGFQPGDGQSGSTRSGAGQFMQGGPDGGFSGTMTNSSSVTVKLMQLLQIVRTIGAVIVIILALLAILGIFLTKDWGRKLALSAAILAIVFTFAGIFSLIVGLSLWIKIAALAIAVAIVVFSYLSKSRLKATVPA